MKVQTTLIPEIIIDALAFIIVISFAFGTYILFSEFKVNILSEQKDRKVIDFANVLIGDKCILDEEYNTKGILNYNKIRSSCVDKIFNYSIIINNEKVYGSDCEENNALYFPVIIKKDGLLIPAKLLVC